jgi:hypothetical protein
MVAVVRERPRLAHQPVDHVPVLDPVLAAATQTRQTFHTLLRVPDLDHLRADPRLHPLADQTARHRIDVALDMDRAATVHTHRPPLARLQTACRQRTQPRQFFGQTLLPVPVELREELTQERLVRCPTLEVPAATQQQRLLQPPLEPMMTLFTVAVLVGLPRLNGLSLQAIVPQQPLVTFAERRSLRSWWHRRRQPIRAVQLRHPAQLPQGILQALAQALAALREADRPRLPVRVRQHEVVDQVVERHALNRHAQAAAVREVAGTQPTRIMHLTEEHFFRRAGQRPPLLDPPLQRPQLAVGILAGEAALQVREQGLGLQTGVEAKQLFELRPDRGEWIGFGAPVSVHEPDLAGQPAQLAVLASGLRVEPGPGRCLLLGDALAVETTQLAHVQIGDHREPPCLGVRDGVRLLANREI